MVKKDEKAGKLGVQGASGALAFRPKTETPMSRRRREAFIAVVKASKLSDVEFAARYDIERSLISQIRNGHRALGEVNAMRLELAIGLPKGTLSASPGDEERTDDGEWLTVRSVSGCHLSAGTGEVLWEHEVVDGVPRAYSRKWFASHGYNPDQCEAWQVRGQSMERTLYDGDTVLLNKADKTPRSGHVYGFVSVDGGEVELLVKRLAKTGGGFELRSDNPDPRFQPMPMDAHIQIIGKAIDRSSAVF